MKKWTAFVGTFILSYLFWILFLMQDFNILKLGAQELIVGAIVAVIVSCFSSTFFAREDGFWLFKKLRFINLIIFIPVYIWELIKANFTVAIKALSPNLNISPGIVKITTDLNSDYGLAMLSNCITLTPGTITMDIYEDGDKNALYIHWIDAKTEDTDKASEIIKGRFEYFVRRLFK
ncbi:MULTISPECIES: Na+/H+ antiporter subunit E [unclassified Clostridium]|uniref:Na+/H+ antiporter subunit E n=1 Tax=Clostridium TaxID=1485 RepID=UPI001C8C368D|nr:MULTISPECIES: Na+/H+ antiporter subunit E [unclassified Clostridium]MBX9137702.1 Na+/H+ antiporter subunit E [Clostridium sp. K12(2020)]MBX9144512.1 Na+/H+ antiporter subunit E [Clostridium sp. K13]MDU2291590.1 Na+/H+ antiporter subunit E [Clostridium celatum]MDU4325283.1 Na+/H+ antiporter subunit E [Clostridium celatum]